VWLGCVGWGGGGGGGSRDRVVGMMAVLVVVLNIAWVGEKSLHLKKNAGRGRNLKGVKKAPHLFPQLLVLLQGRRSTVNGGGAKGGKSSGFERRQDGRITCRGTPNAAVNYGEGPTARLSDRV